MEVHRHLVESVLFALKDIFEEGRYADKVIEKCLKTNRKWGSRDRKFIAEQVYGMVRWWRRDWYLLGENPSFQAGSLIRLWGVHQLMGKQDLPDWSELRGVILQPEKMAQLKNLRAVRESIPDWLDQEGESQMGRRWDAILKSLNEPAPVDLRVNTLRATVVEVRSSLENDVIMTDVISDTDSGLTLRERKNVFATESFKKGLFEVQDRASQLVAPFMQLEPGFRVVDACAGAGGKSLHMAALMKNKGKILSLDIHGWKLKELKKRAARGGIDVIETRVIESSKVIKRIEGSADRVLLDVPCSGFGVLRRNPDTKWKLESEKLEQIRDQQRQILLDYANIAKVGGKLVYSTCSFLPSENEAQVTWFLENTKGWELEEQMRVDPDQGRGDGFFAARMIRRV